MNKFYAVLPNHSYREYESLEAALKATDFFVIEIQSTNSLYSDRLFFKTEKNASHFYTVNGWKFEFVHYRVNFNIKIADPNGAIKNINLGPSNKDDIPTLFEKLFEGLEIFRKHSSEHYWREVELLQENEQLKKEIELLTEKLCQ